jgi:hypothetical protein
VGRRDHPAGGLQATALSAPPAMSE